MFPPILCVLRAQKFWRVRTFSGNSPRILCPKSKAVFVSEFLGEDQKRSTPKIKRFLCPNLGEDQNKKVLTQNRAVFMSEFR